MSGRMVFGRAGQRLARNGALAYAALAAGDREHVLHVWE